MLVLHGEIEERGQAIGQGDGIILVTEGHCCFLDSGSLNQARQICDQFLDGPVERLDFGALVGRVIEPPGLDEKKRRRLLGLD